MKPNTAPARLLCICLSSLALSAGLVGLFASTAGAALIIRNDFTGNGTLRIYLEEQFGGGLVDRIECTESVLKGEDSPTPDAYAKLTSWTANKCTAYHGSESFGTAYVSMPNLTNLPPVEAISTTQVKVRPPTSEPFKIWIEYTKKNGAHCAAQVEMSTNNYTYSTGSSGNQLSAQVSEFFTEPGIIDNCLSAGTAIFEPNITFPKAQFELFDSNNPPPPPPPPPPPSPPSPLAPVVTTGSATLITSNSAELYGTTDSGSGFGGRWAFIYGLIGDYGQAAPSPPASMGPNFESHWYTITGLKPATTYHYVLWAYNDWGSNAGEEKTFTTNASTPAVTVKPVSNLGGATATLNGDVTPNGLLTQYSFEYGTTFAYGSKAPASPKAIGSGTSPVEVSEKIEDLKPETTYHFRLVATNAKGTTASLGQTFTTPPWEILSTANPSAASKLHDVSCEPSTNLCTTVGEGTSTGVGEGESSGVDSPLAQRWNGTSWSEQTAAKKSGSTHNRLFGVDCPSETRCLAVGNYQNAEGGPATLGEIWNENKWSVQTTPVPSEASSSELVAVGCNSTASCRAAGSAVIKGVKKAIVEKWASPTWTLESIPIPNEAISSQLDGVDCLWSNFCVAVGRYTTSGGSIKNLAMFWNGTEWKLQTLTDPEGATQSTLLDVSCTPTPNRCTAVGGWKNGKGEQFTLAYRFDGSTWTLQSTPNPSGSIASVFQEVSCASETSCTAAGSWVGGGASNRTLAEKWNGTTWSIQATPNPGGSVFSAFFGVACRSTTCIGVGWSTNGSGIDTTLGETSDLSQPPTTDTKPASGLTPKKATLNGTVNPNGSETTYQFEYGTTTGYGSKAPASMKSIGSGASSVEVSQGIEGLAPETTYHFRVVATNAKGTTEGKDQTFTTPSWKILSTPNPSGASDSALYDVSCELSTNACTSVGTSIVSGADTPIAQRWNGTSWSEQSAAKKSGSVHNRLLGVDCPSETRCLAVGNYQNSEGGPATLGELWNESKWGVQSTPVPSEATSSELVAVGCNSTANCRAAGSAVIKGVKTAIVEKWVSPTWTLETIPIPAEAKSSQLLGIDCIWSNFCVAVGTYTTSGSAIKNLAMFWNGIEWKLQTLTDPEGATQSTLLDVSCTPTPNRCTAVGDWKNGKGEQFTLAYRFDGSIWTLQSTPNPSGGSESVLLGVSCATETSCTAVGTWLNLGELFETLAEKWNGTSWSIQGTPNPSGATVSALFDSSCRGTTCIGVGLSANASGVETTLAEIRE